MEFKQPMIEDFPYDNPVTKIACAVGLAWVGFILIRHAKSSDQTPQSRKGREGFTMSKIDDAIDKKNRAYGTKVPSNPDVPFYSRHNYNRRRRSKDFY